MRRITAALAILASLISVAPRASAQTSLRKLGSFQTPSGNIHCEEWEAGGKGQAELRCDLLEASNPLPKRPRDCEFDYGAAFGLKARGRSYLLCYSDTIADPGHTRLTYGQVWHGTGGMTCDALPSRLRCTNQDGHGFELSKRGQRLL